MCADSAILQLKIMNNKSIEKIELSKIPRDIWARESAAQISEGVMLCNGGHQSVDLT